MADKKIFYYGDEKKDDFSSVKIKKEYIPNDFKYINDGKLKKFIGFILYRLIATPIAGFVCFVWFGVRIKNRKVLKKIKGGCFLYANHTQYSHDAFIPTMIAFPKKSYVVVGAETVSIKGLKNIVMMLGALPIPTDFKHNAAFENVLCKLAQDGKYIMIYPEAHIWPYYTGVRDFSSGSFYYPVTAGIPSVAAAVTYRRRKIFKNRRPFINVTLSEPFYPDKSLKKREARIKLRNQVYDFFKEKICTDDNFAYYEYIKKDTDNTAADSKDAVMQR